MVARGDNVWELENTRLQLLAVLEVEDSCTGSSGLKRCTRQEHVLVQSSLKKGPADVRMLTGKPGKPLQCVKENFLTHAEVLKTAAFIVVCMHIEFGLKHGRPQGKGSKTGLCCTVCKRTVTYSSDHLGQAATQHWHSALKPLKSHKASGKRGLRGLM